MKAIGLIVGVIILSFLHIRFYKFSFPKDLWYLIFVGWGIFLFLESHISYNTRLKYCVKYLYIALTAGTGIILGYNLSLIIDNAFTMGVKLINIGLIYGMYFLAVILIVSSLISMKKEILKR